MASMPKNSRRRVINERQRVINLNYFCVRDKYILRWEEKDSIIQFKPWRE